MKSLHLRKISADARVHLTAFTFIFMFLLAFGAPILNTNFVPVLLSNASFILSRSLLFSQTKTFYIKARQWKTQTQVWWLMSTRQCLSATTESKKLSSILICQTCGCLVEQVSFIKLCDEFSVVQITFTLVHILRAKQRFSLALVVYKRYI